MKLVISVLFHMAALVLWVFLLKDTHMLNPEKQVFMHLINTTITFVLIFLFIRSCQNLYKSL